MRLQVLDDAGRRRASPGKRRYRSLRHHENIDRLIAVTRRAGAVGAKVCGAGGGGCAFFLVERGAKERVSQAIAAEGATVLPVSVAPRGVSVKSSAG